MPETVRSIRFVRPWRRREPGQIDRDLTYGVQELLVQRGIAEWVEERRAEVVPPEVEPSRRKKKQVFTPEGEIAF